LNREDVQSLSNGVYLIDGVIDCFLSLQLLERSNSYSDRCAIIGTQCTKYLFPPYEEGDDRLRNWSRGYPLHLLGYIMGTISWGTMSKTIHVKQV